METASFDDQDTTETSVFRCSGRSPSRLGSDRWGLQDIVYILLFAAFSVLWYFAWYAPAVRRVRMLEARAESLRGTLTAAKRELYRVRTDSAALRRSEPQAWERAARVRLGWLAPGEINDVTSWRRAEEEENRREGVGEARR